MSTVVEAVPDEETVTPASRDWPRATVGYLVLALLAYVPPLLTAPGKVAADTKQYLYLDPERLLARATSMWDPNVGAGTVTHQTIGYAFPMGPYYSVMDQLGVPDWVAQRLWLGSLMFFAGVGVLYLLRTFGLRGPGMVIAALAYMCTPYVLDYAARISVLLMPWAALPWMIAIVRKALRQPPRGFAAWRYPALFALVVQVVGGVNATALIFAGIGPVLWILYAWLVAREVDLRKTWGVTLRIGSLTVLASLWWISGLRMQGAYGLNILKYSETVDVVASTSTPNEVLRGLGYWFFYGQDRLGSWIEAANDYTQYPHVIAAGYALVVLGLLAAAFLRWRHRIFFVALLFVGVIIAVGAHPYDTPTPLGGLIKSFATGSTAGLALRSTGRAVPLVVLSLAIFLGLAVNSAFRRLQGGGRTALAIAVPVLVGGLIFVNFPSIVDGTFYGQNLQRDETLPSYSEDAIQGLDRGDHETRILEVPGADFASYTWGNTVDPITPGLTDRPYIARELIPYGTPGTADLLNAIDRRIQEGIADPNGLVPLWRRMGIGDVVARNDIKFERYDLVRPNELADLLARTPGLGDPKVYGPPAPFVPTAGHIDELSLVSPPNPRPLGPVVDYPVADPMKIVRAASTRGLMVSGDGEGLVDVADIGLLTDAGIVRYSASYPNADELRAATGDADVLVVTDNNRLRARRWTSVKDNLGFTEQAGEKDKPLTTDLGDARLDVFPGQQSSAQTTSTNVGVERVTATAYGNTITYTPEDRAARAFDGDVETAWRGQAFGDARGQRIKVELDAPITTDHVNLVQPINGGRDRYITDAVLTFDGGDPVNIALDQRSRVPAGQTFSFPRRSFRTFEIKVKQTNDHRVNLFGQADAIGFAEIRLRSDGARKDVRTSEVLKMPTDLVDALGTASADHPLVLVMRRDATRPSPPRTQPELAISRDFTLPTERAFTIGGNATVSAEAPDDVINAALGVKDATNGGVTASSSEFLLGCLECRADAAIDGDPETAWRTPFVGVRGQWAQYETPTPVSFDHLDLQVIADGRHSVPTRIELDVDGQKRDITVPPLANQPGDNAIAKATVRFPRVSGSKIRLTITDVRETRALMYATSATRLAPVGVAEFGIPGVRGAAAPGTVNRKCRDDLVEIDGRPLPMRVRGKADDASSVMGLSVEPCNGPLILGKGPHRLTTTRGKDAGFSIDRLVLASGTDTRAMGSVDGRVVSLQEQEPADPSIAVTEDGRTTIRARVSGATKPFWLVLGQSQSPGWHARVVGGDDLGASQLVDGYANGWLVNPTEGSFDVVFEWTPQQQVGIALWISAIAVLACVALLAITRGRVRVATAIPTDAEVSLSLAPRTITLTPRLRWVGVAAAGLLGALVVTPWVGLIMAAAAAAIALRPRWRTVIMVMPGALLALCALYIVVQQRRYNYPSVFEWPTVFPRARTLAWIAVLLLVVDALVELLAGRRVREPRVEETGQEGERN